MTGYRGTPSDLDPELDWEAIQSAFRSHLGRRAGAGDRRFLDDLVQEGCIRLLRAARREPVENVDALVSTVAHRTWVDFVRRRMRWRRVFAAGDDQIAETPAPGGYEYGDLRDRLQFIVLGLFEREGADACRDLARAYFAETDWKTVARSLNQGHAAVRKRWSRCVEEVRRLMKQDPQLSRMFESQEG